MKIIAILITAAMLSLSAVSFTSCANMSGTVATAQGWLNDPKNQQLISDIASTAISVIGLLGAKEGANTQATTVGKLSAKYPDVPAGALREIAAHPHAYAKTAQH